MQKAPTPLFDATPLVAAATQQVEKLSRQAQNMQPMARALTAAATAINDDPHALMQRQLQLFQSQLALGANLLETMLGRTPAPVITPEKDDRRFAHPLWETPLYDTLKQSYLLTSKWLVDTVAATQGLTPAQQNQALFYTRLMTEAMSPTNTLFTNPEAIITALATQGQSLVDGLKNFMEDMQQGRITMTDATAFKVGQNLAITKGDVVFRNRLIELIQYTPTTDKVHSTPLLICPPWINRYYVLDLQPQNSFVNYAVSQGFTTFMISWKNPDASYKNIGFEDYAKEGLLEALNAVLEITGAKQAHTIGYCIGGTLLGATSAALAAKGDTRIATTTFFTTLLDFANAGDLSVFIDEPQLDALDAQMEKDGFLDGASMTGTFSALRSTDLIWNYVISNYMLGKQPAAFDILVWNADSTRMPYAMHSWYLRQLYLHNNLARGKVTLLGQKVDITALTQPLYMVSAQNDHITPWESCYAAFSKMKSPSKRFVLSKAGHVAGVVNPPTPEGKPVKRSFWVSNEIPAKPADWMTKATQTPDSWWPDWAKWLAAQSKDAMQKAPTQTGNKTTYKPLTPAPGTYVLEK